MTPDQIADLWCLKYGGLRILGDKHEDWNTNEVLIGVDWPYLPEYPESNTRQRIVRLRADRAYDHP